MSCVRGCCASQAEHYRGITLAGPVSSQSKAAKQEVADMAAYRRLRQDGEQPPGIAGAAALERDARSSQEITQGHVIRNERLRREVDARFASAAPPSTTPLESA